MKYHIKGQKPEVEQEVMLSFSVVGKYIHVIAENGKGESQVVVMFKDNGKLRVPIMEHSMGFCLDNDDRVKVEPHG